MDSTSSDVTFKVIGRVTSSLTEQKGAPIQAAFASDSLGVLHIDDAYREALDGLEGFTHLWVLYVFHKTSGSALRVIPYLGDRDYGVFATRAPRRPNPIGVSVVRIQRVEGNQIFVADVDMLDGTPILDLKPYVPDFDHREGVRAGWYENASKNKGFQADERFSDRPSD